MTTISPPAPVDQGQRRALDPSIEPFMDKLGSLSTLPSVAVQIIQVAEDEESDASDLLTIIEQDPAVAARMMRVVNSAHSGVRNEVNDLKMAVTLLGTERVKNLALTLSIGAAFNRATPVGQLDPQRIWDHSVCVASACRVVAVRTGYCQPEEAYLAGLLHDLGLVFVNQHLGDLVPKVLALFQTGLDLFEAEHQTLAFDHAQLGAYVAWRSGMPDRLVTAIDYHHCLFGCPENGRELAHVVHLADYLTTRYGHGAIEGHRLPAPADGTLRPMGLALQDLRGLWDELPEALRAVDDLTSV